MESTKTEQKCQKSTLLLVLSLFFLFNAGHLFRTSINTLYFTEDNSADYAAVEATVVAFKSEYADNQGKSLRFFPVFAFLYENEAMTMEAPGFSFAQGKEKTQPFQQGQQYSLWIHKRWGTLILPPIMGSQELGRSQLRISILFLFLAVAIWILRNRLAGKVACQQQ